MNRFDDKGDLWLEVADANMPEDVATSCIRSFRALPGRADIGTTVTELNLTAYIRSLTSAPLSADDLAAMNRNGGVTYTNNRVPDWASAALTSTSANITYAGQGLWVDEKGEPVGACAAMWVDDGNPKDAA